VHSAGTSLRRPFGRSRVSDIWIGRGRWETSDRVSHEYP
jgi:hypothetical protein